MRFVKWFEEVGAKDVALVGGKNASLGEMIRNLAKKGIPVPSGFAITAEAYKYVIEKEGISQKIKDTLADLDTHDMKNLSKRGQKIRNLIKNMTKRSVLTEMSFSYIRNFLRKSLIFVKITIIKKKIFWQEG